MHHLDVLQKLEFQGHGIRDPLTLKTITLDSKEFQDLHHGQLIDRFGNITQLPRATNPYTLDSFELFSEIHYKLYQDGIVDGHGFVVPAFHRHEMAKTIFFKHMQRGLRSITYTGKDIILYNGLTSKEMRITDYGVTQSTNQCGNIHNIITPDNVVRVHIALANFFTFQQPTDLLYQWALDYTNNKLEELIITLTVFFPRVLVTLILQNL